MKKLFILLLSVLIMLSLVSCGNLVQNLKDENETVPNDDIVINETILTENSTTN